MGKSWSAIDAVQHVEQGTPFERLLVNLLQVNTRLLRVGNFNKESFWSVVFTRLHDHTKEGQSKARVAARGAGPKEMRRERLRWLSRAVPRVQAGASGAVVANSAPCSHDVTACPRFEALAHMCLDAMRATAVKSTARHWSRIISTASELVMAACPDGAAPNDKALPQLAATLTGLLARLDRDIGDSVADCVRSADLGPAVLALALAGDARARHALVMAVRMDALLGLRAAARAADRAGATGAHGAGRDKAREPSAGGAAARAGPPEELEVVAGLRVPRARAPAGRAEAERRLVPRRVAVRPGPALWAGLAKGLAVRGQAEALRGVMATMRAGQTVSLAELGASAAVLGSVVGGGGAEPEEVTVSIEPQAVQAVMWGHWVRALSVCGRWEDAEAVVEAVRTGAALPAGDGAGEWRPVGDAEELRELQLEVMVGAGALGRVRATFDEWLRRAVAEQQVQAPLMAAEGGVPPAGASPGQAAGVTGRMWHQRLRAASGPADAEAVLANLASGVGERAGRRHRLWPGVWAALLDVHTAHACKAGAASVLGRMTRGVVQWGQSESAAGKTSVFRAGQVAWARIDGVIAPLGDDPIRTEPLEATESFKRRALGAAKSKPHRRGRA